MQTKAIALLIAGLAIAGTVLQAPATAEAKTHRVQTVKADVDGDGRADSITVYRLANKSKYRTTYKVIVKTAKGKRAARILTTTGSKGIGRVTKPLITAAALDGEKGAELVIKASGKVGSAADYRFTILTLREGRLVEQASPTGSWKAGFSPGEGVASASWLVFDKVDGVSYSLACHVSLVLNSPIEYSYSRAVSAWAEGSWQPGVEALVEDPRCYPEPGSASVLVHGWGASGFLVVVGDVASAVASPTAAYRS